MISDVARLEKFFLESAANTYAGKGVKSTIPELPGSKVYRVVEDDLLYVDKYQTNGEWSGGETLIYQGGVNVWRMSYQGFCKDDDREVLHFLKVILGGTYKSSVFYGGRGFPQIWQKGEKHPGLYYENYPNPYHRDFSYFSGREHIKRWPNHIDQVFWHEYQGLLLVGQPEDGVPPITKDNDRWWETIRHMQEGFQRYARGRFALPQPPA